MSELPGCLPAGPPRYTESRSLGVLVVVVVVVVVAASYVPALRLVLVAVRAPAVTLGYVILLLFLVIFIYASVGVLLFADVAFPPPFHSFANFRSFSSAMQLLFIMATGDGWSSINAFLARAYPYGRTLPHQHQHHRHESHASMLLQAEVPLVGKTVYPYLALGYVGSFQIIAR